MQTFFEVAERQASGLATLFKKKLGFETEPSPRTIGRAYKRHDVQAILGMVFEMTSEPITKKETSFSADGTGLPLSIKQNYANDRDNQEKHAAYDKGVYHKEGITINKNGSQSWNHILMKLINDPQKWLSEYHERSNVECYNSSHKRRFTRPLLKHIELRGVEAFAKIIATNIIMLTTTYF